MRVHTNLAATQAQMALQRNEASITLSMQRLSTGYRINSAADSPAGLAMTTQGERNSQ